jgi:hypothetical protein
MRLNRQDDNWLLRVHREGRKDFLGRVLYRTVLVGIVCVALAESWLLFHWRHNDLAPLADAAKAITDGQSPWPGFQSRVFGPFTIKLIAALSGSSFLRAYLAFMAAAIIAKDLLTYLAVRRFRGTLGAISPVLVGALLYDALQITWIYPWDPVDAAISATIIYYAADPNRIAKRLLAIAYLVALFNRESSLFIGLFFVIAHAPPIRTLGSPANWSSTARRGIAIGSGMMLLSLGVSALLQRLLLVHLTYGLGRGSVPPIDGLTDRPPWRYNLELIERVFVTGRNPLEIAACVSIAVTIALFAIRLRSPDSKLRRLALLALIEMAAIFWFGVILELRVFSGLVPFLALFAFSSNYPRSIDRPLAAS